MNKKSIQRLKNTLFGFFKDLAIALIIVVFLNTFIIQNLRVEGNSMAPTIENGNLVMINKWLYYFKEPKQGDIIGFYSPNLDKQVVKRIIGVPGDEMNFKENMLYCNDRPILENQEYGIVRKGDIKYPYTVPEDSYFVVGDNYNESIDSRYHYIGVVERNQIIGRIKLRLWPFGHSPLLK